MLLRLGFQVVVRSRMRLVYLLLLSCRLLRLFVCLRIVLRVQIVSLAFDSVVLYLVTYAHLVLSVLVTSLFAVTSKDLATVSVTFCPSGVLVIESWPASTVVPSGACEYTLNVPCGSGAPSLFSLLFANVTLTFTESPWFGSKVNSWVALIVDSGVVS